MSGEYGLVTLWRTLKANLLSLTSFQVGLYGWMAIYQIGIWNYKLGMDNVVYWWIMQVGMQYYTKLSTNCLYSGRLGTKIAVACRW